MVCDEQITKEKILGSSETLSIFFKMIIQDIPPSGPAMQLFNVGSSNKHDITCECHLDHHHHHDTDTTLHWLSSNIFFSHSFIIILCQSSRTGDLYGFSLIIF